MFGLGERGMKQLNERDTSLLKVMGHFMWLPAPTSRRGKSATSRMAAIAISVCMCKLL